MLGTGQEFETNENGRYYVQVTLDGCTVTSETINVRVSENPDNVTVTANGPLTFCAGRSVRLDAPSRSTYTYVWEELVGDSYVQRDVTRSLTVNSSGTYRVLVINEGLCEKYSDEITVTVLPQPTAAILTQGSTICQDPSGPTTFTITGTYSGGTGTWAVTNGFSYAVTSTSTDAEGLTTSTIIVTAPTTVSSPISSVVSLTSANPAANCGTQARSITIGVQPLIAGNTIAGAFNYCQGTSATDLSSGTISGGNGSYTYQWQQSASENGTYTNVALGGTGPSYRPSTAVAGTMYYRRVVTSGQCSSTSNAIAVIVTPSITTNTIAGKANYCKGEAGEALGGAVSGGNGSESYTYVWQSSTTGAANSWDDITNSNSADYTPQTSTASTTYYRRGVESGNCTTYSNVITVTVTENISNNSIATTAPVAGICTGASPDIITGTPPSGGTGSYTYVWERSTESPTAGFREIPDATGQSYDPDNLNVTTWFRRVVKSGNCEVTSEAIQVKVNPVIANNSFTSQDQIICNGSAAAIITATSPTGGDGSYSYVWQRSTTSATAGFSDIPSSNTPNYNPGNLTATTWFRRKVISGGCENITSAAIRVTVNPQISGNSIAGTQTVCSGAAIDPLGQAPRTSLAGGATPYSFQWERRVGTTGSWTEILGATAASYTPPVQTVTVATTTFYRRIVRGGSCSSTSGGVSVTVNPLPAKPTITNLRPVVYTADDPIEMRASHGSGTFAIRNAAGTTVSTSSTFHPCTLGAGTYTVTYTYSNGTCSNTSDPVTVTVKTTTYTAVVVASPFPICKGQNTEFTAMVYRDVIVVPVTDPRHPDHGQWLNETYAARKDDPKRYWQDFVGVEPLDANGKLQSAPSSLIMNSEDIAAGGDFKPYNFTYQWYRNSNGIGSGRVTAKSAGLSATDEFWVQITPNTSSTLPCSGGTTAMRSNSMWLSAPTNYSMTLSAQNPICKGDGVRLTATPNVGFDFSSINLQVNFYIKKAGALAESEPTRLNEFPITVADPKTNPNDPTTYSYDVAPGIIENGDVVSIFFSTDVVKCLTSGDAGSFITMVVNERPAIATQPTIQTVCANTTATLTVGATGADLTYQWYKRPANNPAGAGTPVTNGGRISGAATASLRIANAAAGDAGLYYVIVGGFCPPTVQSENVELIVNPVTVMTIQPVGNVICPGASHTFTTSATGTNVTYQWYKGTTAISGANLNTYTISNASAGDAGNYTVIAKGECGEVRSTMVTLVVNEVPVITSQPSAATVCAGTTVNFNVAATGTGITYQWYKGATALSDGSNIAGARTNALRLSNVQPSDAGNYRVIVSGTCSPEERSREVALTVETAPAITGVPQAQEVCAGTENISFSVTATGANLTYRWYHNGRIIPSATENTYTVPVANTETAGSYRVEVIGTCLPAVASEALLTVNSLPMVTVTNPSVCEGQLATVVAEVANGSGDYTYTWTVPEGVTNPGNVASFRTNRAGTYTVEVTDSKACASSQAATSTVTINPIKMATGDLLIYDENNVQVNANQMEVGKKYTFKIQSNILDDDFADIASIKWYMGDGTEENWKLAQTGNTEFVVESMGALKVSVRCDIPTAEGACYDLTLQVLSSIPTVPLPVELIYFKAEKRGNDVAMEWATASEKDNKGFEVQVSTDGKTFRSLSFVESRVINSSMKQVYTFVDKENGKYGTRYYRLKQIDLDGKFEYFSTKAIQFGAVVANKVNAYPNPFHSEVELSIDAEVDGQVLVTVTNATGQQLLQRTIKVEKGANIEKLTLDPSLPRGIYIISTRMGEFNNHFKLLKQ